MPTTRSQACSAQPAEQVTSPRDHHTPRRVLRSRQGNAGVIVNTGEGSPSFIVALGDASGMNFTISHCKDKRCKTCKTFDLSKEIISNVTKRKYHAIYFMGSTL